MKQNVRTTNTAEIRMLKRITVMNVNDRTRNECIAKNLVVTPYFQSCDQF